MLDEFKKFAMRGNVIDLAIGVIIGAAFGAIVASLVNDIIMPVIGAVTGGLDFSNYYTALSSKVQPGLSYADAKKQGAVFGWGQFLTVTPELFDRRVGVIHGDQGDQQTPSARASKAAGANARGKASYGNTGPSRKVAAKLREIVCPNILFEAPGQWEAAAGEVVARTAVEPHLRAVLARNDAEAVMLDFVQPLAA